jgi:uncharacterized protein (TIGR03083 family)
MTDSRTETSTQRRTQIRAMVAAERRELADVLDGLSEQEWDTPSLCTGWRVREVVAHMTAPFRSGTADYELGTTVAEINAAADRLARREAAELTSAQLVAALRDNAEHPWEPLGDPAGALTHDVVHGLDATEPLGTGRRVPTERLAVVLAALTPERAAFFGTDLTGIRLVATDLDWTHGDGEDYRAPAQELLLFLCGRRGR